MSSMSLPPLERSRKAYSSVLQALGRAGTQASLALALGVSESTVSRTKTEKLEDAMALLYQLGFKVVPEDRVCVDREMYDAMCTVARKAMSCPATVQRLNWEEE